MGSSTSKAVANTELEFQLKNCRTIRDSLKTLRRSLTESTAGLSSMPKKILTVADGFAQVSTCVSHASPGATASQASPSSDGPRGGGDGSAVPNSTIAVEMATDFTDAMRQCDRDQAPQYALDVQRDVGTRVDDLIALADKCTQYGKTAQAAYSKLADARSKVESIEASAKKKNKDVNGMAKYTDACTTRSSADRNYSAAGKTFQDTYRKLTQDVAATAPALMQQYAQHTMSYQRAITSGIAGTASQPPAQRAASPSVPPNHALNTTQASKPIAYPMEGDRYGATVGSPFTNPSGPSTRAPSAPPGDDNNGSTSAQRPAKEPAPLPTPKSEQRNRDDDAAEEISHEPTDTVPATRANRKQA